MPISLSYRDVPKIMLLCLQKYPLLDSMKILLINYKFKLIIDLESIISSWSGSVRVYSIITINVVVNYEPCEQKYDTYIIDNKCRQE
jgi:hypothetical protein